MHEVPLSVGLGMSAKFFPVWTFTSINMLFFSRAASPLDHPCWLISWTGSQYVAVFSVEVLTVVCGTRDIGYVARRRVSPVSPPGGQTRGTSRIICHHEPNTLGVDLQPGKTVSTSPLTLNMTAMYTSGVMAPPPGISTQDVLPLEVPGEDSSFSVSPLSPGLFFQPPRRSTSPPAGGALLPTTADDCVVSGLGDPITAAWCKQYPGSESPWSLPLCVAVRLILSAGPSGAYDWVGFEDL